ncbi:unnamed protein product, partial [Staurois parvus]
MVARAGVRSQEESYVISRHLLGEEPQRAESLRWIAAHGAAQGLRK